MRSIARRVVSLEDRRRLREGSLGYLTDAELLAEGLTLIRRIEGAGVRLPPDWQNLFNTDAASFLSRLSDQLKESTECVD